MCASVVRRVTARLSSLFEPFTCRYIQSIRCHYERHRYPHQQTCVYPYEHPAVVRIDTYPRPVRRGVAAMDGTRPRFHTERVFFCIPPPTRPSACASDCSRRPFPPLRWLAFACHDADVPAARRPRNRLSPPPPSSNVSSSHVRAPQVSVGLRTDSTGGGVCIRLIHTRRLSRCLHGPRA